MLARIVSTGLIARSMATSFRWMSVACSGRPTDFGFPVTNELNLDLPIRSSTDPKARPAFQIMDFNGRLVDGVRGDESSRTEEDALQMYKQMVTCSEIDKIGY